jgi:phage terminase large subunit
MIRGRINFHPKPHQAIVMRDPHRHRCVVAHRRSGKTVMAVFDLLETMLSCPLPYPRVAYIAPFRNQAKKLAWDYLATTCNKPKFFDVNRGDLEVTFKPTGAKFFLLGADNIDAIRGIYLDKCAVDELADCDPRLWSTVLRPCLADRGGRALMMGTPRGRMNMLYDLSRTKPDDPDWSYHCFDCTQTGMVSEAEIEAMRRDPQVPEAMFEQEMMCSFNAALIGAVYGREMNELQARGRYTSVNYDKTLGVMTAWDLGWQDATAVIYLQRTGSELRCIHCEEYSLMSLADICREVRNKPWGDNYVAHYGPHDLAVHDYGSGKSRIQIAREAGIEFEPTVNWSVEDGIEAVRAILPHLWISAESGERLLECLCNYRFVFDDRVRSFKTKALHDWTSHCADAIRMFAVANDPAMVMRPDAPMTGPRRGRRRELAGSGQRWLL